MTVQDISGGRLVLGVGLGAPDCERADRGALSTLGTMADRFADVVHGYLAAAGGATEWQGATMSFSGLQSAPAPEGVVPPELLVAAHGPRALALAVAVADTWNTYGGPASTHLDDDEYWDLLAAQAARFNAECGKASRDPATVRRSVLLGFGRVRPTSSVGAFLDAAARAEALGFDEMVVYAPPSSAGLGSDPHRPRTRPRAPALTRDGCEGPLTPMGSGAASTEWGTPNRMNGRAVAVRHAESWMP